MTISYTEVINIKKYSGVTNGSGTYSVTYPTSYMNKPLVFPSIETSSSGLTYKITNSTPTGFSVMVEEHDVVNLLGVDVLSSGFSPAVGVTVNVLVVPT